MLIQNFQTPPGQRSPHIYHKMVKQAFVTGTDPWSVWCSFGSLPSVGIWPWFCWHLIFPMHTGQIRTLPYTRAPWIRSPRRCSKGDHRSCSLNEVMEDPVTKTQSCPYLLMCWCRWQTINETKGLMSQRSRSRHLVKYLWIKWILISGKELLQYAV